MIRFVAVFRSWPTKPRQVQCWKNCLFIYKINEFTDRSKRLTWDQALEYCRTQGADLVSVHTNEEQAAISRFVVQQNVYSYVYFWMGLNDLDLEGGYAWSDGKKNLLPFSNREKNSLRYSSRKPLVKHLQKFFLGRNHFCDFYNSCPRKLKWHLQFL